MYGQFSEDPYIQSFFKENKQYFGIEVGSAEGLWGTPTRSLEEQGWNILCIEANPTLYEMCRKNRKSVLNYAVSDKDADDVDFKVFDLTNGNLTAISSLKPDDRLIKQHHEMGYNAVSHTIKIKIRTLDFCISEWINMLGYEIPSIDFISIDTENTEIDVLKGFDILKWTPTLIALENNFEDSNCREYMISKGYHLANRIGVNDYFSM